jgi:DNA repair protein RadC
VVLRSRAIPPDTDRRSSCRRNPSSLAKAVSASSVDADVGLFVSEQPGHFRAALAGEVIAHARALMAQQVRRGVEMTSVSVVRDYLRLNMGLLEHEVFVVIFLDAQLRLIEVQPMFRGTVVQTAVYPREVVKAALLVNAASVLVAHNHPSGVAEPSRADEVLTTALKSALSLVDVRLLDHLVVSASEVVSLAERGLL